MADETGRLIVIANRGGTITEISTFLSDLENAYIALYAFDNLRHSRRLRGRFSRSFLVELGYPYLLLEHFTQTPVEKEMLPPNARLTLERIQIESPGVWEFAASLNPLQQIREYLNYRHRHRQDHAANHSIRQNSRAPPPVRSTAPGRQTHCVVSSPVPGLWETIHCHCIIYSYWDAESTQLIG